MRSDDIPNFTVLLLRDFSTSLLSVSAANDDLDSISIFSYFVAVCERLEFDILGILLHEHIQFHLGSKHRAKRQPEKSQKKEVSVRRVEMRHMRDPLVVSSFLSCCSAATRRDIFVYIKSPNPLYDLILRLDVSRRRQCGRVCARK